MAIGAGDDAQRVVNGHPPGTTYIVKAGIHLRNFSVQPKSGDRFCGEPGAVLDDPAAAAVQLLALVRDEALTARDGSRVAIRCDSVCLHGDRPDAASYARHLRAALAAAGVAVAPPRA